MTVPRVAARPFGAAAVMALAIVAGACSRNARPAARPTPRDTTAVARRPDTTARADTTRRVPIDTAKRDTARRVAADTTPTPRARRRDAANPTARCGAVNFAQIPTAHVQSFTDGSNNIITYTGGGVIATCEGVKNRLQSDSAEYYQTNGQLLLINNVSYDEAKRAHLTSNRLTYFTKEEHIVADGNVVVTLPTGTTMTGPNAEYFREAPAIRDRSRLVATGRPTLRVISIPARDTATRSAPRPSTDRDTAIVIANTIVDEGDSLVFASGQVDILRTDVRSSADSAMLDQGTELARLINRAQINGQRGRPFTLNGTRIDLFSRQRDLTRIRSQGTAHVVSKELDLKSDTIDLRVRDSRVERAYAWGPSRATAVSPDRDVVADSIDAQLPNQRIRELHAVRRAVVRSLPDTTKIATKERDELAGDTIVAHFDTLAAQRDTTKNPPVRVIVASGNAHSLFQVASNRGRSDPAGINYVQGRQITAQFDSGQLRTVTVLDSARGVYLEPGDSTADSTRTRRAQNQNTRPATPRRPRRPSESAMLNGTLIRPTSPSSTERRAATR